MAVDARHLCEHRHHADAEFALEPRRHGAVWGVRRTVRPRNAHGSGYPYWVGTPAVPRLSRRCQIAKSRPRYVQMRFSRASGDAAHHILCSIFEHRHARKAHAGNPGGRPKTARKGDRMALWGQMKKAALAGGAASCDRHVPTGRSVALFNDKGLRSYLTGFRPPFRTREPPTAACPASRPQINFIFSPSKLPAACCTNRPIVASGQRRPNTGDKL